MLANATPLMLEFCAGHALAMQCGARASQFLDRAAAVAWDERANLEALRMAGLMARLMDGVQRLAPRVRGSAANASAPASASRPASAAPGVRPLPPAPKQHAAPGQRRGRLKNGNPSGDYLQAPRCGARTRAGCACRQPAMPSPGGGRGRYRMHGGLSTGPRTPEGLARSRSARLTHGYRTAELIGLRHRAVHAARRLRSLNRALSAGHGVDRSDSRRQRTDDRGQKASRPVAQVVPVEFDVPAGTFSHLSSIVRPPSAGHGVDRSDSRGQRKDDGRQKASRSMAPRPPAAFDVPVGTFCRPSSVFCPPSAGHGLHRSYRDRCDHRLLSLSEICLDSNCSMFL